MQPSSLHQYFKQALAHFRGSRAAALRSLIEAGGVENFLTGLLFLELHSAGVAVSREFPIGDRCAADLTLHLESDLHVELKQLNLKDGCGCAPQNLINDLRRHGANNSIGIIYVSDERSSSAPLRYTRFNGANRKAKHDVIAIFEKLPKYFGSIFPLSTDAALLRAFPEHGGLSLYAFVVTNPLLPATAKQRPVL